MFDKFPFTNVHELNLDWILRILNKLKGGTKDQVLTRLSNKPLDFGWKTMSGGGGGGGTTDYNDLGNKPSINGVTLEGNKTSAQLNIPVGPELANTMPLMDGTPQIGNSSRAAKADHVHPSDTSKASMVDVRAEIYRAFNQYDPAEADYDPPYAVGTLGYAIENAAIAPEDIQDAVDAYLDAHPALTGMFTNAAKNALIALLEKVAYVDGNGQQYLNELITNLAATVTSISAVFTQGANVFYEGDSLELLRVFLTVTADYSDGTSGTIESYSLSGTLTAGTSTITVSYEGQTDTFDVTVTAVTYRLTNYTFDGANSNSILTGLTPLQTNAAFTLLIDADFNDNTAFSGTMRLFTIMNATSPWAGLNFQAKSANSPDLAQITWMTNNSLSNIPVPKNFVGKVKIAIVHEANTDIADVQYKIGSASKVSTSLSSTYQTVTAQLVVGGNASGACLFKGTVNSFTLYPGALSSDRVNAFMGA